MWWMKYQMRKIANCFASPFSNSPEMQRKMLMFTIFHGILCIWIGRILSPAHCLVNLQSIIISKCTSFHEENFQEKYLWKKGHVICYLPVMFIIQLCKLAWIWWKKKWHTNLFFFQRENLLFQLVCYELPRYTLHIIQRQL